MEIYALLLDRKGYVESVSASAVSQLTLVQSNPYLKVAYFGVACSDPFHFLF